MELLQILRQVDPATLALVLAVGVSLERRIRRVERHVEHIEAQVELILNGHRMVGDGPSHAPKV